MGKWNSRETGTGAGTEMGTCKNHCYSLDSLPVKFTELCKPSHKHSIIVKFFLSHNKHWPAQNSISTDVIHDLLCLYNYFSLFNTHYTSMLIHSRLLSDLI